MQKREKVVIQLKVSHFVGPTKPGSDHIITRTVAHFRNGTEIHFCKSYLRFEL